MSYTAVLVPRTPLLSFRRHVGLLLYSGEARSRVSLSLDVSAGLLGHGQLGHECVVDGVVD